MWIIDKDHFAEPGTKPGTNANAVGFTGPRGATEVPCPFKFRMLTDDGDLVYEGRSSFNHSFAPLNDFGQPNFGCTSIQYMDEHGQFVGL